MGDTETLAAELRAAINAPRPSYFDVTLRRAAAQLTATQENYDAIKSHNQTLFEENGRLSAQLAAARDLLGLLRHHALTSNDHKKITAFLAFGDLAPSTNEIDTDYDPSRDM